MSEDQKQSRAEAGRGAQGETVVNFKYFKSNFYRIVHANGVIAGLSRRGEIHLAFYSERPGYPDKAQAIISPAGAASPERVEGGEIYVREIEVDAVIDLDTAKQIAVWLSGQIAALEADTEQARQRADGQAEETMAREI